MIKTIQPVSVETRDKRSNEDKIVYAEITKIEIIKDRYVIYINEFVYDEYLDYEIEAGNSGEIIKQKRPIVTIPRVRDKVQLLQLIDILKDVSSLTSYGLIEYVGIYETLNQVEKNEFVAKAAHLIENNRDLIRGVNWEKHTESS